LFDRFFCGRYNSGLFEGGVLMRAKLIIGNWKMNGSRAANAELLNGIAAGLDGSPAQCAVCVPAPYLQQCQDVLSGSAIAWGAQDVSVHACGPYTGEVCAAMLAEFACRYVIVGHSERRAHHRESSELVARKALAVLAEGMTPIVCVGETLAQREAGETMQVVGAMLAAVLDKLDAASVRKLVVAYEPVWAIGTGRNATPDVAQAVHAELRAQLRARDAAAADVVAILYGGSMKPENARALLAQPDIDGGLIGGAALKADEFLAIMHAA
jgi:triosephosphate isomerase